MEIGREVLKEESVNKTEQGALVELAMRIDQCRDPVQQALSTSYAPVC